MHQRVRCAHCHHWTDALLVWAAGDCCPSCNAPMIELSRTSDERSEERPWRSSSRLSIPAAERLSERP